MKSALNRLYKIANFVSQEFLNTIQSLISQGGQAKLIFAVCVCGTKILLVPDLDEMARTIKAHAAVHKKREPYPEKAKAKQYRIEELLIQKVFMLIAETSHVSYTNSLPENGYLQNRKSR